MTPEPSDAIHPKFAAAALAIADGDLTTITQLLAAQPDLIHARSAPPFRAPLLHYSAANGVEDDLQRTPKNAVAICRALLDAGADPDALGESYGGGPNATALCLLVSSWHPHGAGLQADLVHTLVQGGAAVDGRQGDGAPMTTALAFGYTKAAEALAHQGARTDNLFFAAGLGHLDAVRTYVPSPHTVTQDATNSYTPSVTRGDQPPAPLIQEALHFAVTHGRQDVAAYLIQQGADPNGTVPGHHCELPLLQAAFVHKVDMALWLLTQGANPHQKDAKRGTTAHEHVQAKGPEALKAPFSTPITPR